LGSIDKGIEDINKGNVAPHHEAKKDSVMQSIIWSNRAIDELEKTYTHF